MSDEQAPEDSLGDKLSKLAEHIVDEAMKTPAEGEKPMSISAKVDVLKTAGNFYVATRKPGAKPVDPTEPPADNVDNFDAMKQRLNRRK